MSHSRTFPVVFLGSLITAIVAVLALSTWLLLIPVWQVYRAGQRRIPWQDYTSDRLAELLSERRNILLVGFAEWNISSALPLHLIETPRIRRAIAARDIVPVSVNFTKESVETDALREFYGLGEHDFTFVVIITGNARGEPVILSEWPELNDKLVFETITKAVPATNPCWE
jgi:hypothetical protein